MKTPADVKLSFETGWVQLVRVEKVEDGRLWLGGYSIRYDRHGNKVSESPVRWHCTLSYA